MVAPKLDLDEILAFTIGLAREAGDMILKGQARRFATGAEIDTKANEVDLVTEVDKAVEAFIFARISAAYPSHSFVGEETYAGERITNEPTWIGAPIDGTTNFIHGYPLVATSIGLAVNGVPVLGVIYNPFLDQLYTAAKGRGAWLNGKIRLPISGKPRPLDLASALISVDIGNSRAEDELVSRLGTFKTLSSRAADGGKMVHSLRSVGCTSLNLCLVASGGQDIRHWEIGGWPWDVCAGMAILAEAGGVTFGGKDSDLSGDVDAALLVGRRFLFVRAVPGLGEARLLAQRCLAKEFYDTTEHIEV
ncbi:Inositol monophosphatase 2 [Vanrija pseudolonga]|uniref:Inositol-1-monophosphatase n=1 Tax=Vanrija pseudolonga TaxID=143232 RepID=A0AAF0YKA0_9TREE|nr:Inositol monophosphatase 2 [Vanrija pseudolonga]